jgi:hypothetical protein
VLRELYWYSGVTMRKLKIGLIAAVVLAISVWQVGSALAQCDITASNGNDDVVICNNPPDSDGIYTWDGNDRVTVEHDVRMETSATTIDTGAGDDRVYQWGTIHTTGGVEGEFDPVNLQSGSDAFFNFGELDSSDDGVGCAPYPGETCRIYNYEGASITAAREAVDFRSNGGSGYIYNAGTITSPMQEAIHLHEGEHYKVFNNGTILAGSSGVEVYHASLELINRGLIDAASNKEAGGSAQEFAVNFDAADDILLNYGTINSANNTAVSAGRGNDTIENYGTITAQNSDTTMSVIEGDDGNDLIVNSGTISESGNGYAAIEGGHGSDTIVIQGGTINGLITGDQESGGRSGDWDLLLFELKGTDSEIASFRESVQSQGWQGVAIYQGQTYRWQGFEEVQITKAQSTNSDGMLIGASSGMVLLLGLVIRKRKM